VEFAVDPLGRYCTVIVQLEPGAIAKPLVQVPPVTENEVAVGPVAFVTDGAEVNVNAAAFVPVAFETVMVPFFVAVVADPVLQPPVPPVLLHIGGTGAEIVNVAPCTVNGRVLVPFPPGLLTRKV
jgi:hypothetical protein